MSTKEDFYKRYRKIYPIGSEEQIEKRWDGVVKAAEDIETGNEIIFVGKMFFGLLSDQNFCKKFCGFFSATDEPFDEECEEEIQILSGSVLDKCIRDYGNLAAVLTVLILGDYYDSPFELKQTAVDAWMQYSRMASDAKQDSAEALDEGTEWKEKLKLGAVATVKDIAPKFNDLVGRIYSENAILKKQILRVENQIEILSWIIGEWSDILDKRLQETELSEGVLVLPIELAGLLPDAELAYPAEAFLTRVLLKCKEPENLYRDVSMKDLLDGVDKCIRQKVVEIYCVGGRECRLPFLAALSDSLSVDVADAWISVYRREWKIDPNRVSRSYLEWAGQMFLECFLYAHEYKQE